MRSPIRGRCPDRLPRYICGVAKPTTIEEVDKQLEQCRKSLSLMQVRSSKELVWVEIDSLLSLRLRLTKKLRSAATVPGDRPIR